MPSLEPPALSVIIPAYNGGRWISETLSRLPAAADGLAFEAIVIDNASSDNTSALCHATPHVTVLVNEHNRGFSQAVNQGARIANGHVIVVINQDLFLQPRSLREAYGFLAVHQAVLGGRLLSADGNPQPSAGPFPSLPMTIARLSLPRGARKYYLRALPRDRATRVDWVTGAFMAFPRAVFDAIGGFDDGYFMYYEDVDFCLRARQKGFPIYYFPSAEAVHVAPYAERKESPEWLRKEVRISQVRYFNTHRPRWEASCIRVLNHACFAAKGWDWPSRGKAASA